METGDPQPWRRPIPDTLVYRASPVRVLVSLSPFIALLLAGCAFQYASQGALSHGMEWVVGGFAVFVIAAILVLPRINYLEFTPQHFTLREPAGYRQIPWDEIEPGSIGHVVRTMFLIPMFTTIGFRLNSGSRHLTTMRAIASVKSGMHVTFMNLYPISRDELVDTLRRHQESYGSHRQQEW